MKVTPNGSRSKKASKAFLIGKENCIQFKQFSSYTFLYSVFNYL